MALSYDPFRASQVKPRQTRPDAEKISIVAVLHKYPPWHNAGAEWMVHGLLREMVRRGHEVLVLAQVSRPGRFQGVPIEKWHRPEQVAQARADVVLTHLDLTRWAVTAAGEAGLPLVHVLHNDRQLQFHGVRPQNAALCLANSQWIREAYADWEGPMAVVHPPVEPREYRTTRPGADRITLMNLSVAKGGPLFWRLAERMPDRRFLAVAGAYAHQCVPNRVPPNVRLVANTPRVVTDVYAKTRLLLMPSSYESWGRCAIEAGCSGIPTVAHPTPGLVESLGTAGVWRDLADEDSWVEAIEMLLGDSGEYRRRSKLVVARAEELDPALPGAGYDTFERLMVEVVRGTV